jgi:mono/diheme cytochrome c family protein
VHRKELSVVKKIVGLLAFVLASGIVVAACSGSSNNSSGSSSSATTAAATDMPAASTVAPAMKPPALPIPLAKLKSMTVAKGSAAAGKLVFDANCASCHGAGGKNEGGPGPTIAGVGLKAGQVAFMIRNPAAIDPDSAMPKLTLTDKQVADVAAYVASQK